MASSSTKRAVKCCVGGCSSTNLTHKLFMVPQNDKLRSLWMSFLVPTNSSLLGLSKNQLVNKRVCEKHFDDTQFDVNGERIRYSYPCLFSVKEIAHGIPLNTEDYVCMYNVCNEHNYCSTQEQDEIHDADEVPDILTGDLSTQTHKYSLPSTSKPEPISLQFIDYKIKSQTDASPLETSVVLDAEPIPLQFVNDKTKSQTDASPLRSSIVLDVGKTANNNSEEKTGKKDKIKPTATKTRRFVKKCTNIAKDNHKKPFPERATNAQELGQELVQNFHEMNKKARTFLLMQLRLANKKKMSRRFTLDDKLFALALLKNSPKSYKLLSRIFALPSKRTLSRLSEKINLECGLNQNIIDHLKTTVEKWDTKKRLCSIVFDEVALTPYVIYDERKDMINGFVEIAGERKKKFADHALVFMIRGICSSWRQSIAYYFCEGTVTAAELELILKQIVPKIKEAGLTPLALICDQGSTFRACIKNLRFTSARLRNRQGRNENDKTVHIAGSDLFIFHDPPHLLKSVRNNFLTKDILSNGKVASWSDILYIYDVDTQSGHTRALPKLTAHHVDPTKIKKMQVRAAAQVLSARTAAMLEYTSSLHKKLDVTNTQDTMANTAEIVFFFDDLFDSVNGSVGSTKGKLRTAVKPHSPHLEFWAQSITKLKDMKYIDKASKHAKQSGQARHVVVPCIHGWISTLESFQGLANLLFNTYNVEYFYPRCLNQDPLENFFGRVRAMNCRNINPDANAFIYTFKSMIITNILSPQSQFTNCEEDEGEAIFNVNHLFEPNLNCIDKENVCPNHEHTATNNITVNTVEERSVTVKKVIDEKARVQISAYTAGYLCRKISKKINCNSCAKTYTTKDIEDKGIHQFIKYREYKRLKHSNLAYPNARFLRLYRDLSQKIHGFLNIKCHKKGIKKQLKDILSKSDMSWLGCKKHGNRFIITYFVPLIIRMHTHAWCTRINRILMGKTDQSNNFNDIEIKAYDKYKKHRARKGKLNK